MIRIITDTAANLPAELIQKYNIIVVPLSYTINDVQATQNPAENFNGTEFYNAMRSGADIKTSMSGIDSFIKPFKTALEQDCDIMYLGISGGISGTVNAARLAADELKKDFPNRKIIIIDTLAASLGEGLQVLTAAEMIKNGFDIDTVEQNIASIKKRMCQFFTVDDLNYLKKGGRISGATAVVGTMLNIKPILTGDEEGKIVSCGRVRGKRVALANLAEKYMRLAQDKAADIGIAHADDKDGAEILLTELKKRGFYGNCITVCYEPVTGAHVGPGTVALFFLGIHK